MSLYLCVKFQVSSMSLTSLRQGEGNFTPPPHTLKRTPKKPTQITVNGKLDFLSSVKI